MIDLYFTKKLVNNTTTIVFAFPVAAKRLALWGGGRVEFYDVATIAAANALVLASATPRWELQGTVNRPFDEVVCGNNEILNFANGLVIVGYGFTGTEASVRVATMGNPVGSQGS